MSAEAPRIHLEIGSQFENIELVQIVMETSLRQLELDADTSHRIGISVREAVANAIKHGNREDPEKRVKIDLILEEEGVVVEVRDQGEGFDPGGVPDPRSPDNLLRPNGRGLLFMQSFMDEIDYRFEPGQGMVVTLRKSLSVPDRGRARNQGGE